MDEKVVELIEKLTDRVENLEQQLSQSKQEGTPPKPPAISENDIRELSKKF